MRMAMVTLLLAAMGLSCSDGIPEGFISEDEAYRMALESAKWRGLLGDPILCGAAFMTLEEMDALRGGHTEVDSIVGLLTIVLGAFLVMVAVYAAALLWYRATHADAGQMHFYLNYARQHWVREGENPPVGLILCSEKDEALAQYAREGLSNTVKAAEYRITLPDEEFLAAEVDRTRQAMELRGSIALGTQLVPAALPAGQPE